MNNKLVDIASLLFHEHGIDISIYDDSFLKKSLEKRLSVSDNNSLSSYYDLIIANPNEVKLFLDSLNITFSEFFRNPLTFAYLEQIILPTIIEKKKKAKEAEIRIWSAACAAGHEAYSIAILLDELIGSLKAGINCHIFATDINQSELSFAQRGIYQTAALHKVSLKRVQTYFTQGSESFVVAPQLKKCIDFSVFDLLKEQGVCPPASIYGNFDLVVCSNLLFYYKPEYQQQIINKVGGCITTNGYLITGETEREIIGKNGYREVFVNSAIFQKIRQ